MSRAKSYLDLNFQEIFSISVWPKLKNIYVTQQFDPSERSGCDQFV